MRYEDLKIVLSYLYSIDMKMLRLFFKFAGPLLAK